MWKCTLDCQLSLKWIYVQVRSGWGLWPGSVSAKASRNDTLGMGDGLFGQVFFFFLKSVDDRDKKQD